MIRNCITGIMGTVEFDGQFGPMKKPQDFIVYPKCDSGPIIHIQSRSRFGEINLDTGNLILSKSSSNPNMAKLGMDIAMSRAERLLLTDADRTMLRDAIKKTGGLKVGDCGVVSDNTGAMEL